MEEMNKPAMALAQAADVSADLFDMDTRKLGAARMEVVNPLTKRGTGQYLWLFYNQHPKVQAFLNGEADAEMRKEAERAASGKDPVARTVEQGLERTINLLCVATDRWENVFFGGQVQDFNVPNGRKLYALPYIREQATAFMRDLDNFTKG